MEYTFTASGHPNISAAHLTTLEFTRDSSLTPNGDCIVAINADFDINKLKRFLKKKRVIITISTGVHKETVTAQPNPLFNDEREMVIRKSGFVSSRTFATGADKAAVDMQRGLIEKIKERDMKIMIRIE